MPVLRTVATYTPTFVPMSSVLMASRDLRVKLSSARAAVHAIGARLAAAVEAGEQGSGRDEEVVTHFGSPAWRIPAAWSAR